MINFSIFFLNMITFNPFIIYIVIEISIEYNYLIIINALLLDYKIYIKFIDFVSI